MSGLSRSLIRRLPGIGWRDAALEKRSAQVEKLRARVSELEADHSAEDTVDSLRAQLTKERAARKRAQERLAVDRPETGDTTPPSFRRNLLNLRRNVEALRPLDPDVYHPVLQIPRKMRNYRLAASHGVATPEILGVWGNIDDLDLSAMPERFVLKSELGAGGHGVFPLRRIDEDRFELLGETREQFSTADLIERYHTKKTVYGPYFAEGFLDQRVVTEEIPDDIKIYASYGEVSMVLLRRMPEHANLDTARYRYTDSTGRDLGDDIIGNPRRIDSTIPLPEPFEDFIKVAQHLSRAVATPFIRVDVYDTANGPVLGELTRAPGGAQRYRRDQDIAMGRAWDEAQWRLDLDVINGRPLRNLHGLHPATNYYPADHVSHSDNPRGWEVITADCAQWCFGGALPG